MIHVTYKGTGCKAWASDMSYLPGTGRTGLWYYAGRCRMTKDAMSKQFVQNKYHHGDKVYAKVRPDVALIIRRYVDQVYYCRVLDDPDSKEQVYFERELAEKIS